MTSQLSVQRYPTLTEIDIQKAQIRRERAIRAARQVLYWLATQSVEAGVFGSLARGLFKAHSDVDFLILNCPERLRYRLEAGIEDRMEGLPFNVVYLDEIPEPLQHQALQEVARASDLR